MCYNQCMKIVFRYIKINNRCLIEEFLDSLSKKDKQKLLSVILNTQEHGIDVAIRMNWVKKLDNNLYELRSQQSSNIQRVIYFHIFDSEYGSNYIFTHGFTKKTQKTPRIEIDRGKKIRDEFLTQPTAVIKNILQKWKEGDENV